MNSTTEKFNVNFDFGHLLVNDAQTFNSDSITEEQIKQRGVQNLQVFYKELFKMCGNQVGEDDEKRDFDKPKDTVKLPATTIKLPRSKPLPKAKPLTKWEKYRLEKGLTARKKRGRMVYSELAGDWVPRYGKGR
jgi:regulator of ribosome biosynthesis